VQFAQGRGVTRDVSSSGIFFETDVAMATGVPLSFTLEYADTPCGPLRLQCEARVVRVERCGEKFGVGVAITAFKFERKNIG
jgi:hypothetical protein